MAIYGFARLVDDVGDEVDGDRAALLHLVESELDCIYAGGSPEHELMRTLAVTVRECRLPDRPFRRLIEANRLDQRVTRYETFEQLVAYCQLSATPVGELVLHVFDAATPDRIALSDHVCTALQVIEHLQDVDEDFGRGRVYVPQQDLTRFGCVDEDLSGPELSPPYRAMLAFEIRRAGSMLSAGAPLARTLPLRPRLAVAGFVAGGRAALDGLQSSCAAGVRARPATSRRRFACAYVKAAFGR
jgi:squalene synthase HpnC